MNTSPDNFTHYSVLLNESIDGLNIKPDGVYFDLTLGGGGHSEQIARRLTSGRLICFDADNDAIEASKKRLAPYADKITFVHSNFRYIGSYIEENEIDRIDGAVADLGVSSYQLDCAERGFSYMADAPLDMRMDVKAPLSAYDIVNSYSEADLKRIIFAYGEENYAPQIARGIVRRREEKPIETTLELAQLIKDSMPAKAKIGGHHPAKKTFQAIRIQVNGELDSIPLALNALIKYMSPGGRISVITFHSLEDRIVKNVFSDAATGCTCPPNFPVCVCGNKPKIKVITKKPLLPSEQELEENPRSRSAKLRIAEKI